MPTRASRHLRKMRGGAQSHLIEAADGAFYVVKYINNPQHRRILVNEWIAAAILNHLEIAAPPVAIIEVDNQFIQTNAPAWMQLGTQSIAPEPGWHFGSKFPGDPDVMATYDFVPDQLIAQVHNLCDFLAVLAFDKWAGNSDGRQAVFFRAQLKDVLGSPAHPRKMGFVAWMIDHGYAFNGPHWELIESPVQGLYSRKMVYNSVRSLAEFEPWIERIRHFPESVLDTAVRQIPPAWLEDDEPHLERVLEKLLARRKRVGDLILDAKLAKVNPFANWPA